MIAFMPVPVGLSPRVRGSLPATYLSISCGGSIPACAGEPRRSTSACPARRVYPRVCGGAAPADPVFPEEAGLSPRVRGSHLPGHVRSPHTGSIPACAGEPCNPGWSADPFWVYPRVCGGASSL